MKPVAITVAVAMVVVTVGYSYASPYVVLHRLKAAADARDAIALSDYVDYPALRVSLKEQAGEMVQRRIGAEHSNNPLLLFGAAIGTALIGPIVDAYATPEGVAALLNGIPPSGKPGETPPPVSDGSDAPSPARSGVPAAPDENKQARPQSTAGYRSLNEFVVTWQQSANGEHYSAVLQRHGPFSWKLAAVELNEPARPAH
ncbi:DUF2939 domain-containing protein [Paraburkholderia adhaesiva]|uniref:DUF2939 domain-containing protein n=1 Tax=Paraburkholderia adhaesiva TaxID=2883244 RepID=UPI001F3E185C|nr:DUF2939 domain-containing protein [Paraburkholderia adhaesiva]